MENNKTAELKTNFVIGLRFAQFVAGALCIIGLIWGSSDWLSQFLVDSPITPLSVLLMLYGFFGTVSIEAIIRLVQRKKE